MKIDIPDSGRKRTALVSGRLDVNTADEARDILMEAVNSGCRDLTLDLANVEYLSSYGLRIMLMLAKRLQVLQGDFAIEHVPAPIMGVLTTSGFNELLTIR